MNATQAFPLPVIPPECEAFAAEHGASEYLSRVVAFTRDVFPTYRLSVELYEDPEIHDLRSIFLQVLVPPDTDFTGEIATAYNTWIQDIVTVCPSTHTHLFGITFLS